MRLSLCIRLSGGRGEVRRPHPGETEPADGGPGEQVLLDRSLSPQASRAAPTTGLVRPQNVARRRFRAFLSHPSPEAVSDVPVETGKHSAGSGTVAVIVRPSAQDRVDLLELVAKVGQGGVAPCQLLDRSAKTPGFRFGDFDTWAIAVALVPSHGDMESDNLEPVRHRRDLRLFRR